MASITALSSSSSSADSGSVSRSDFISIQEAPSKEDSPCRKESIIGIVDPNIEKSPSLSESFSCLKLGDAFDRIVGQGSCETGQIPRSEEAGKEETESSLQLADELNEIGETESIMKVVEERRHSLSPLGKERGEEGSITDNPFFSEEHSPRLGSQSLQDNSHPLSAGTSQSSMLASRNRHLIAAPEQAINDDRFIDADESFPQVPKRLVGDRSGSNFSSSKKKGMFLPMLKKEQPVLDVSFLGHKTASLTSAASRPYSGHLSNHRPSQTENGGMGIVKCNSVHRSSNNGNNRADSLDLGAPNSENFSIGWNTLGSGTRNRRQAIHEPVEKTGRSKTGDEAHCASTVVKCDTRGANRNNNNANNANSRRKLENIFDETIDIAELDLELPDYVFNLEQSSNRRSAYSQQAEGPRRFARKHFKGKKNQMMTWIHSRMSGKNLNEWRRKVSGPQRKD